MRMMSLNAVMCLSALLALAPTVSSAAGDGSVVPSNANKQGTTAAASKVQKCAETKKKIADYEAAAAAAPKGAKVSGSETIKSDISWYKSNCG